MAFASEAHLAATVRGRVQGVGYRSFAQAWARALGLKGYVQNLSGGAVEVRAEGPRERLEEL
ncbi:MAG: acylphosphatase, partial [Chloroflexota bacterium]